jgi:hypothetical protein
MTDPSTTDTPAERALDRATTALDAAERWRDWANALSQLEREVPARPYLVDDHLVGTQHISVDPHGLMRRSLREAVGNADTIAGDYCRAADRLGRLHAQLTAEDDQ